TNTTTAPFNMSVAVDPISPTQLILHMSQGGTLMGDREYYLSQEPSVVDIRAAYVKFLEKIFTLVGRPHAADDARAVLALETQLAAAQWSRVDSRDLVKTYNRIELMDLPSQYPGFDWLAWAQQQQPNRGPIVAGAPPSFFKTVP